ncbi:MAG: hypothetical protein CMD26_00755 [Flavobacteriales bacterium]|nr:hypothetical protein [Flavobacteriales bacterium]
MLFYSCNERYNTENVKNTSILELKTSEDLHNINRLDIKALNNNLKIAKFNLSKIEEMQLDSITIELMYFEYRDYLHCVNNLYESLNEIEKLKTLLNTNITQLANIKKDYKNSRKRRNDLDYYLFEESQIIENTSIKVNQTIYTINYENKRFVHLNKKIEELIN